MRGEKQWQTWAQNLEDWGIQQENVANTRIPYASTLVQTKKAEDDDENDPEQAILYEKEEKAVAGEKMGAIVPLNQEFLGLRDDDPKKMESMIMEDVDIPLNLRLLHVETSQGDELIIMEKKWA